jgi:hypothetical protein
MLSQEPNLSQILSRPRRCAADWLIIQANSLAAVAESSANSTLLVFSCLEARNAIEQLWADLLTVVHGGAITKELFDRCRRQRDGFLAEIHRAEPKVYKLSRFATLCLQADPKLPFRPIVWNLSRLKRLWQSLSRYCHAQAASQDTLEDPVWFAKGISLVREAHNYFQAEMSGGATALMRRENMKPHTQLIWDDFAADRIDEEQVAIRLRITQHL